MLALMTIIMVILWIINMAKQRVYSHYAREAMALLGEHIKLGRKQRRWTEANLAERANISRATLQKIENGEMSCAVGLVFEVATLTGVPLFDSDKMPLTLQREQARDKIALLPQRIKPKSKVVYDDC